MSDHIASVDAGNGGVNAVISTGTKKGYKSYYTPSVRAAATGDTLGIDHFEMSYSYVDWNGHRYVTGDDVTKITKRGLERHVGSNRYGNEFHQMLVAKALAELGVKSGEVDLTLFAPPGLFVEARQMMLDRFMTDPPVKIQLKKDKSPREWSYKSITVWPEGMGAAMCIALDADGKMNNGALLSGDTVILDAGAHTLDALKMSDGNFNPEQLEHATWEAGGVDVHIRQPILRAVKKMNTDFETLTVDDIDRVIRSGLTTGDYIVSAAGLEVDIEPLVKKYAERYAEWTANNICDGVFGGFKGIKSVILVGGGAVLIEDYLTDWYGDKILDRKKHAETKKIHPVDMNAVGGMRMAMFLQRQKKRA